MPFVIEEGASEKQMKSELIVFPFLNAPLPPFAEIGVRIPKHLALEVVKKNGEKEKHFEMGYPPP